jgi:hypothetical protein
MENFSGLAGFHPNARIAPFWKPGSEPSGSIFNIKGRKIPSGQNKRLS